MTVPTGFRALPLPIAQLSLAAVLKCGQSFRWCIFPLVPEQLASNSNAPTHEYRLCLRDRVVCLRQSPNALFYRSVFPPSASEDHDMREAETLAWIRDYFQLDINLIELYEQWGALDPVFKRLQDRFEGIRVLRQDPFENLISFICSSNNNIARITKMVKSLCLTYSPPLLSLPPPTDSACSSEDVYHPFPLPSALASTEVSAKLRALGFGYRADFIQKTAAMLVDVHGTTKCPKSPLESSEEWLLTLRQLSTADARTELLKFMGVGRKVADCILLMSLDKREVIPVDTHVYQIAIKHYGLRGAAKTGTMSPKVYDEVSSKLAGIWGNYAGWAHSVLFTSDLKAFASYGLSTPSTPVTPALTPDRGSTVSEDSPIPSTPDPTSSDRKRKRAQSSRKGSHRAVIMTEAEETLVQFQTADTEPSEMSLADRVKRRKRGVVSSAPVTPTV